MELQIISLIEEINPKSLTIPGIGPLSAAVIYAEYGDLSKFSTPSQMLSFAGLESGYYQSGMSEHGGRMVKRGSSHLRFTLMNLCMPLIRYSTVFAEYYAKKRGEGKPHRVACSHLIKKLIRVIFTLEKMTLILNHQNLADRVVAISNIILYTFQFFSFERFVKVALFFSDISFKKTIDF